MSLYSWPESRELNLREHFTTSLGRGIKGEGFFVTIMTNPIRRFSGIALNGNV
jgi:hypothetical protein